MNLPIHSLTLGKDGYAYLCLKVPQVEGTTLWSEHVTIKFSGDSMAKLQELYEKEKPLAGGQRN